MITTRQRWQMSCYPKWLQKILYLKYRWLRVILSSLCLIPLIPMAIITNTLYAMYREFIDTCKYTYQDIMYVLRIANRKGV